MVKRAAATNFIALSTNAEVDALSGEILFLHLSSPSTNFIQILGDFYQILKKLVVDELSTVRVIAVECIIPFIKLLKKVGAMRVAATDILPVIHACYEDASWKIRLAMSKNFGDLADCFDATTSTSEIFPGFVITHSISVKMTDICGSGAVQMLQDMEPDIRINVLQSFRPFLVAVGSATFLAEFIPIVSTLLLADPVPEVRKAVAELCVDLSAKVSPDQVSSYFVELILRIMTDEDPLVRLRVVQKIPLIATEIPSLCSKLVDSLKTCMTEGNWRIRKGIAIVCPNIMKSFGTDFFSEHFLVPFLDLLKDGVDEVRAASGGAVAAFISSSAAPVDYVYNNIFPVIKSMALEEYMLRLSALLVLQGLLTLSDITESFRTEIVQIIVNAANDKVANIRLRATQVLGSLGKNSSVPDNVKSYAKLVLTNLQSDKDKDVQQFAVVAIKAYS